MFGSSKTKSSAVAVPTTTKSASEKLLGLFEGRKQATPASSSNPLPTLYNPHHTSPFPSTPGQSRSAAPRKLPQPQLQAPNKKPIFKRFAREPTTPPAKSTTSNVPRRRPTLRHSNSLVASQGAAVKFHADFLAAQKRATVRLCAKMDNDPDAQNNVFYKVKNDVIKGMGKRVLRERMREKWFKKAKPMTTTSKEKMDILGEVSALPDIERFSTSKGLNGVSRLGMGDRYEDLSYGIRGDTTKTQRVVAVPQSIKVLVFTPPPTTFSPPNKVVDSQSKVSTTPVRPSKPKLIGRYGRKHCRQEKPAQGVVVIDRLARYAADFVCDTQGRPVRSKHMI
ncbi:hypothetical protein FRC02_009275 [Tulasnella sp. 418]|nr:hypothetical protein FRC02_009275 [Tulasnella sp. 418]